MDEIIDANITFQGGGAKGILHVGAVAAIEEFNENPNGPSIDLVGFSGSSIGALIAALLAVGYESKDLISDDGFIPLAKEKELSFPSGLLNSRFEWLAICFWRAIWNKISKTEKKFVIHTDGYKVERPKTKGRALVLFGSAFSLFIIAYFYYLLSDYIGPEFSVGLFCATIFLMFLVIARWLCRGIASLTRFETILNEVLCDKVFGKDAVAESKSSNDGINRLVVTYGDIQKLKKSLRIVATNVDLRELALFSEADDNCCDISVSKTVCASMAIPGLIQPFEVSKARHFDGGLVSNIPVWVFDQDRTLNPDLLSFVSFVTSTPPNLSVSKQTDESGPIEESNSIAPLLRIKQSLLNLGTEVRRALNRLIWGDISLAATTAYASVFGSQMLEFKKTNRLFPIDVEIEHLGVLDLDVGAAMTSLLKRDSKLGTLMLLEKRFLDMPDLFNKMYDGIKTTFEERLKEDKSGRRTKLKGIRIFFAEKIRHLDALKIISCSDPDEGLCDERTLLPLDSTVAGQAFTEGESFLKLKHELIGQRLNNRRDRFRRKFKWDDAEWCLSIPLSVLDSQTGKQSQSVLIIESDIPLKQYGLSSDIGDAFWQSLTIYSAFLGNYLESES